MRVSIHQPSYLPYGGFFAKLLSSDLHIVLDTVLYSRQAFQTRNRIRDANRVAWLTVPVHGKKSSPLDRLTVDQQTNWSARHWRTIVTAYGKAGTQGLSWVRGLKQERFVDVADTCLRQLSAMLGIDVRILRASQLRPATADQEADQRLIDLMNAVGGNVYVSGAGGRNYMDLQKWKDAGIDVTFCDWLSPAYPQEPHDDFVPNLSVVDLIARMGPEQGRQLILSGITLSTS